MSTIAQQQFNDEVVSVDGQVFEDCVFTRTTLAYEGGEPPTFTRCRFVDVKLQFAGTAASTFKFLNGMHRGGFAAAVERMLKAVRQKPTSTPQTT